MLAAPPQELSCDINYKLTPPGRSHQGVSKAVQKIKALALVLLALMLCFSMTFLAIMNVMKGYQITSIKQEINTLQRENERLQLEVARLRAPERIAAVATDQLGMAEPQAEQICYIPDNADTRQMVARQPVVPETKNVATAPQSWLQALSQVLQQWLSPERVAGARG
jgi:cell division protein FtsL